MVSARMSFNADLRGRRFGNTNILQYHCNRKYQHNNIENALLAFHVIDNH
jgi:hypothetical protein